MDEHGNYGTRLRELRCDCHSCRSEDYWPADRDCLWFSPWRYALDQGASEDTADEFAQEVREQGFQLGVYPPTKEAWKRFRPRGAS